MKRVKYEARNNSSNTKQNRSYNVELQRAARCTKNSSINGVMIVKLMIHIMLQSILELMHKLIKILSKNETR